MQIQTSECPVLLRDKLHELFPAPEVFNKGQLTMATLSYKPDAEVESGAKNVSEANPFTLHFQLIVYVCLFV